jgi:hypothetical protein
MGAYLKALGRVAVEKYRSEERAALKAMNAVGDVEKARMQVHYYIYMSYIYM